MEQPIFTQPDLDIDCSKREEILSNFINIPATKITNVGLIPHGVGVYFCDIPKDLVSGLAAIDYKDAEERLGYVKFDFLHNTIYDNFNSRSELLDVMNRPIAWDRLKNEEFVKTLPHIGNYFKLMNEMPKIDSIEKLAMFISIIRPGKAHLVPRVKETNDWNSVAEEIWVKPDDGKYYYKKSHAISYAMMISIMLR